MKSPAEQWRSLDEESVTVWCASYTILPGSEPVEVPGVFNTAVEAARSAHKDLATARACIAREHPSLVGVLDSGGVAVWMIRRDLVQSEPFVVSADSCLDFDYGVLDDTSPRRIEYPLVHQEGTLSIESLHDVRATVAEGGPVDLGVQIAPDGRVWVCVDGQAFLRFKPTTPPT